MPRWVRLMLLGMGAGFAALGLFLATACARWARADVARLEGLPVVDAAALRDRPAGAEVVVEGTIGAGNPPVFREFVAFAREELEVTRSTSGGEHESWRPDGAQTPSLVLEAGGEVRAAGGYGIARGHMVWYDDATLGFNRQERAGSRRYHALVAGGPVTAVGAVADGPGGKELAAAELFGGSAEEYLASRRAGAGSLPVLGAVFLVAGLALAAAGALTPVRRPAVPG